MSTPAPAVSRERMLAAFEFRNPDRIPLYYHPSVAGLHVHGQKLLDLFRQYPSDNPVDHVLPVPPAGTIQADGSFYQERTDEWGVRWAHNVFGIQGHPVARPFASWRDGLEFPLPPLPDHVPERTALRQRYYLIDGWAMLFQVLYAVRPMEDMLVDLASDDPDLVRYLDRLAAFWRQAVGQAIASGTDAVMFGDDWATQTGPLVSPELFRRHFRPRYRELFDFIHAAGRRVFFHCCGRMDYVLDELLDLGIDGLWPQIGFYDSDEFARRCRDRGVTLFLHHERQHLMPRGTPAEVEAFVARMAERYHKLGGGGIFYVEIEHDAPWANVEALFRAIERYR